ncbi:FMN reductase [Methylobacillus rhizosphaerae]|uniref:FMN reductase n=1 Tax=Methylobacillus rhizosphaerae TaxID=551994 RepID=A0A238ZM78_9PROT|nr:FMN reductase [Methylobacillus rhizosphaerae]SNR83783.1 FMN reductase [Methylobacillus rhizosphaerae]
MSKPLKLVAISGSLSQPSRTTTLLKTIVHELQSKLLLDVHVIELQKLGPSLGGSLSRLELSQAALDEIARIEAADFLVVATPVYRASVTGLFKHLFDFVGHETLFNTPVFLAATGGSDRHALVIDHQLRPLFSFFQALTLPLGVYGTETDFIEDDAGGYDIGSDALQQRIALAVERALPFLQQLQSPTSIAA